MVNDERRTGTAFGIAAYLMWGSFPLFWKLFASVDSAEILAQRLIWAGVFAVLGLLATRRFRETLRALRSPALFFGALACGIAISLNWGIYIWAVNSGRIIECSIGYYLNPLISVLFGVVFLKERIDAWTIAACALAAAGIAMLAVSYGTVPIVALSLAASFAVYGLLKKVIPLRELGGLASETVLMFPLAIGFLALRGESGMFGKDAGITALFVVSGPVTAIPLLCYAAGVKRIPLSRMGFLQYISPTIQLILGVFVYGEDISGWRLASFCFVVSALALYSLSRFLPSRRNS